ncbi:hypothetical protein INS49_015770 [Diaporthe citri]|uniref:uncharacterized protein n=1 Tax=Diaporthe citri TaxID=83186 RepID=UPI001C81B7A8|nr:uncharacterized protein INS49_015770 [Diaporthe citri]KAG6356382.1 hypothetical protein INS49_015770 [Diaporthe citri]
MMDPFSAIGLAGNIVGFLDFGFKLLSKAREIQASASGTAAANENLVSLTQHFQRVTASLRAQKVSGAATGDELAIQELAAECDSVAIELMELVDSLRARTSKSKRESLRAAFREWRKGDQKDELQLRLDRCRSQLNLQLTSLMRSEALARLDKLITFGQASESELQSLNRNVEQLRLVNNASYISPDTLEQIHSLLSLTDTAILRVRQARVLECLRFQLMNERFEDVEEAHERTFDWIFDSDAVGVHRRSSRSSQASSATTDSSDREDHDLVDKDIGAPQDPGGRHNNIPLSSDEGERGRARSQSPSQIIHGSTRSPGSHSATLSVEHERDSTEKEVLVDNARKSGNYESDADSSIMSYAEIERLPSADQMSILSEGQISVMHNAPHPRGPVSPSRVQDVPEHLWQVMEKARDDFIVWLERDHGIFHISGKPGSGKSTLMKYLCQHRRTKDHLKAWAGEKTLSIGEFFFWRPGSALQKSLKGIIRGLLHCVLSEAPELIPVVFPAQWEESMFNDKIHIEHHECQQGFTLLTSMNANLRNYKFAFFVDGLDEFDGNHSDLVRQLFDWVTNSRNVKLCVSSREWAVFHDGFKDCPHFSLHDLTRSDMQRVVRDRFQQLNIDTLNSETTQAGEPQTQLQEDDLVEKSEGVFLWLSLVLRHLEEGLINGDDMQDLMKITDSLPTELEPMLRNLLDSIPRSNLKLAFAMLSFASFAGKIENDCRLMQFSFVEDYMANKDFAMLMQPTRANLKSASENAIRLRKARRRVYGVCKGFLDLRQHYCGSRPRVVQISDMLGEYVRLNHRSIVEFLDSDYFSHRRDPILPDFNPWDAYLQTYLGQIGNVDLPEFYFAPDRRSENRGPVSLDTQLRNIKGKCIPLYLIYGDPVLQYSPSPSFREDLTDFMLLQLNLDTTVDSLRFCHFLSQVRTTIRDLQMDTAATRILTISDDDIRCNASELVALLAAAMGLHEYMLYEQDLTSAMIERCTRLCLSNFHSWGPEKTPEVEAGMGCLFKTLEALFDRGGSPDLERFAAYPLFHTFLQTLCIQSIAVDPGPPCLAIIAFMLYHGANPGFSITLSRKPLKGSNSEVPLNQTSAGSRLLSYKASFRSYKCTPTKELEGSGNGTALNLGWLLAPWQPWMTLSCPICEWPRPVHEIQRQRSTSSPVPSPQAQNSRHRLIVQVPEEKREALDKADHRVDLRTLVSTWFPNQAENLQKVIDWILELGVPLNKEQRLQLKQEFGDLLRPYFDQAHPDFHGWLPGNSPKTPDEGLLFGFQFQIHHVDAEPLDRHQMQ